MIIIDKGFLAAIDVGLADGSFVRMALALLLAWSVYGRRK